MLPIFCVFVTSTSCLGRGALPHLSSDQQSQTCSLWPLWSCKAGFLLTHTLEKNACIYKWLIINASVSCVLCALLCQLSSVTEASSPHTLNTGDPQWSVPDAVFSLYAKSLCWVGMSQSFSYHCCINKTQLLFFFAHLPSCSEDYCLSDILFLDDDPLSEILTELNWYNSWQRAKSKELPSSGFVTTHHWCA